MAEEQPITIGVELMDLKTKKPIRGLIKIKFGVALSIFDDKTLAKRLYEHEKSCGNKHCFYDKDQNAYIEQYTGMTANMIKEKIKKELESQGGKFYGER